MTARIHFNFTISSVSVLMGPARLSVGRSQTTTFVASWCFLFALLPVLAADAILFGSCQRVLPPSRLIGSMVASLSICLLALARSMGFGRAKNRDRKLAARCALLASANRCLNSNHWLMQIPYKSANPSVDQSVVCRDLCARQQANERTEGE